MDYCAGEDAAVNEIGVCKRCGRASGESGLCSVCLKRRQVWIGAIILGIFPALLCGIVLLGEQGWVILTPFFNALSVIPIGSFLICFLGVPFVGASIIFMALTRKE
ncbi:MAG: hypothetical protein ACKVQS_00435 [Fimbriimonadaceae bacterium]